MSGPDLTGVRIAVAYTSLAGIRLLLPRLKLRAGDAWAVIPKTVITSVDYGLTDPQALQQLVEDPDHYDVRVANPSVLDAPLLKPVSAFHPKLYVLDKGTRADVLLGSPNLTDRALTMNSEIAIAERGLDRAAGLDDAWELMTSDSVAVDAPFLDRYRALRPRIQQRAEQPDAPALRGGEPEDGDEVTAAGLGMVTEPAALRVFADAVDGGLAPDSYECLWIEAGSMSSGGSHNQLELPRAANRFFGFRFEDYGNEHQVIGFPTLRARGNAWNDRPLTWHGNNRMERLNLPTFAQGGFRYEDTVVLFRRVQTGFEIEVAEWDSPLTIAWRHASDLFDRTFRLGHGTERTCGVF
jgi:hypothetical protein